MVVLNNKEFEKRKDKDKVWIEIQTEMTEDINEYQQELWVIHSNNDNIDNSKDITLLIGIGGGSFIVFGLLCLGYKKIIKNEGRYESIE